MSNILIFIISQAGHIWPYATGRAVSRWTVSAEPLVGDFPKPFRFPLRVSCAFYKTLMAGFTRLLIFIHRCSYKHQKTDPATDPLIGTFAWSVLFYIPISLTSWAACASSFSLCLRRASLHLSVSLMHRHC